MRLWLIDRSARPPKIRGTRQQQVGGDSQSTTAYRLCFAVSETLSPERAASTRDSLQRLAF